MKKLFSLLLCVVMVLSLVACGSKTDDAQTPDEPQDTAPELSGTMKVVATGDVYGPLFDAFTADTGVEVECLSMSSGEVLSKLRAEGGTPSADLWFGGGIDAFMSAKDDGLLEPVTFDAAAEENDLTIVYPSDGMPWVPEGVAVFKNAENVDAAKYFVEWLFSSDDHLRQLAEIEQKNGIKVIKPSIEGIELSYDPTLLMTEDLSLFGSQRTEILDRFEPLMGDKAAAE